MGRRTKWSIGFGAGLLLAAVALGYFSWRGRYQGARPELLSFMPPEANTVAYADLGALRDSRFLAELLALAPSPGTDRDYAEFVRETGFDYARDLNRVALAVMGQGRDRVVLAVADGHFDQDKIVAYAVKSGKREMVGGRETFRTSIDGSAKWVTIAFLSPNRIALTDGQDLSAFAAYLIPPRDNPANAPWRERFRRLAGSPVFAVSQLGVPDGAALAGQPAGGLRFEQLAALSESLRWGTVALRPQGDSLLVVAEAECANEDSARKLSDEVSALATLAGMMLANPKTRRQLDADTLAALDEMLKSVEVSRIDRGETKAVRIVFPVTSRALEAARQLSRSAPN
ncbi:MAG: hypothetical protein ABSF92_13365 [Candidatus Acidiferrales bacterium]|jgi:hypothetical protein